MEATRGGERAEGRKPTSRRACTQMSGRQVVEEANRAPFDVKTTYSAKPGILVIFRRRFEKVCCNTKMDALFCFCVDTKDTYPNGLFAHLADVTDYADSCQGRHAHPLHAEQVVQRLVHALHHHARRSDIVPQTEGDYLHDVGVSHSIVNFSLLPTRCLFCVFDGREGRGTERDKGSRKEMYVCM